MWQFEPTPQFERDKKWYEKKRPLEFAAVMHNLTRYLGQLAAAPNSRALMAGFLHPEPHGVVAIDQKGGGGNLQETRLYTYADDDRRLIYLITIGDKSDQHSDIQFCKEFADGIRHNQNQ